MMRTGPPARLTKAIRPIPTNRRRPRRLRTIPRRRLNFVAVGIDIRVNRLLNRNL